MLIVRVGRRYIFLHQRYPLSDRITIVAYPEYQWIIGKTQINWNVILMIKVGDIEPKHTPRPCQLVFNKNVSISDHKCCLHWFFISKTWCRLWSVKAPWRTLSLSWSRFWEMRPLWFFYWCPQRWNAFIFCVLEDPMNSSQPRRSSSQNCLLSGKNILQKCIAALEDVKTEIKSALTINIIWTSMSTIYIFLGLLGFLKSPSFI